jgi:putative ABC transport system permease protein
MSRGRPRNGLSAALYRLLILAYPRAFRARFGPSLVADFRDLIAERAAVRPLLGRLQAWGLILLDLALSVPREHLDRARRRIDPGPARISDPDPLLPRSADIMLKDLRVALRNLGRQPGFALLAVLTLALGMGAGTATFSAVNAVLLRPLPYKDPQQLTLLWNNHTKIGWATPSVSGSDLMDYREQTRLFQSFAILGAREASLTDQGEPQRIASGWMSSNLLELLGIAPLLGRGFTAEEEAPDGPEVAMLGHGLWQRRFGGDPAVLGRSVHLDGKPFTIVGVLPPQMRVFLPAESSAPERVDVWQPVQADLRSQARNVKWATVLARLKPGVALSEAQAEMDVLASKLREEHETHRAAGMQIEVHSLHGDLVREVRLPLLLLLGGVAFVLLIACANVANLLLARAAGREREMAVRAAMGASRTRIVRQVLTEGLLLACLGGGLGLLLAHWGIEAMLALRPANLPRVEEIGMDPWVLGFALLLCLLTPVLFGLAPALYAARADVSRALHGGVRAVGGGPGQRLGRLLVVGEVALSLILPIGAVLLLKTFANLQRSEPGFQPQGVWTAGVALPAVRYPEEADHLRFFDRLEERLRQLPGVEAAALASSLPLSGGAWRGPYADDPRAEISISEFRKVQRSSDRLVVTPGAVKTLGMQLVDGRFFTEQDDLAHPRVIVVDETLARKVWPGQSAVGKRLLISWDPRDLWMEVVGVVRHVRIHSLRAEGIEQIYFPLRQVPAQGLAVAVRSSADPAALTALVRRELAALDPGLPLAEPQTLETLIADHLAPMRFTLMLVGFFAAAAVVLAVAGLYGVLAYGVSLRTREIGVRMALGARPWGVTGMVLRQGLRLTGLGIGLGLLGAAGLSRLLESLLFGVAPLDPATYLLVAASLGLVTVAAILLPAARAARVDPKVALLCE